MKPLDLRVRAIHTQIDLVRTYLKLIEDTGMNYTKTVLRRITIDTGIPYQVFFDLLLSGSL